MFAGYQRRHQVGWLYGWLSTHGQGVDLTAIHAGSAAPGDQGTPGSVKWRLMLESLLTRHGTLPSTAANGGRYDPSWSREADDDVARYTAKLLSFVKKHKMAAAAIMNCNLDTLDHPRSLLHGRKSVLKIFVNRTTFGDYGHLKILKILSENAYSRPPKFSFFWGEGVDP